MPEFYSAYRGNPFSSPYQDGLVLVERSLLEDGFNFEFIELLTELGFHQISDDDFVHPVNTLVLVGSGIFINDIKISPRWKSLSTIAKKFRSIIIDDNANKSPESCDLANKMLHFNIDDIFISRTLYRAKIPNERSCVFILSDMKEKLIWRLKSFLKKQPINSNCLHSSQIGLLLDPANPFLNYKTVILPNYEAIPKRQLRKLLISGYDIEIIYETEARGPNCYKEAVKDNEDRRMKLLCALSCAD